MREGVEVREVLVWGLLGGGLGGVEAFWEVLVWNWWGDFVWSGIVVLCE